MSTMQKAAWFNLAVIGLTFATIGALLPFIGTRAMGGLGCLGFLGLQPLLFRKRPGQVLADERDRLIQSRSWIIAYALFWVVFVVAAVWVSSLVYGENGAVPVHIVQMSVAWAFMFVYAVASIAVLIQYGSTRADAES